MGDTVKTRILAFINYKGMKMKAFEDRCNLSSGYITSMRKGFGSEKLNNVLTAFPELNREWLLYGEGDMLNPPATSHTVVNGNGNNTIVGDYNNVSMPRPNKYGDSPDVERKWAPVVPRAMASMPDFDIIGYIKKQMTGGNVERLYSGTLDIDIWHYIETRNLEPKFEKGDCLGLKSFEVGHEFIREGDIHVVDTKSKGLVTTLLFSDGNGGYYGMATFPKEHKDVVIPKEDVIRIYRKVIMFRY